MKIFRIFSIALLVVFLIYSGFKRERYLLVPAKQTVFSFVPKYPRIAPTDFKKEMSGLVGFSLSPKLTSAILYSLIFLLSSAAIVHLGFLNKKYTRITIIAFAAYMAVCFILIQLGNYGLDYKLSFGLSHYLEDLFLSPFPLMILVPLFIVGEKLTIKKNN